MAANAAAEQVGAAGRPGGAWRHERIRGQSASTTHRILGWTRTTLVGPLGWVSG